jgi:hypothetical protein
MTISHPIQAGMLIGVLGNTNRLFGRAKATGKVFIALSSRRSHPVRTTETTITFRRPFTLSALDKAQPAGTYRVVTEEEEIDGLSFVAFRRTATLLHLPALATASATQQVVTVDPLEWTAILEADGRN